MWCAGIKNGSNGKQFGLTQTPLKSVGPKYSGLDTVHKLEIGGLTPNTTYYLTVIGSGTPEAQLLMPGYIKFKTQSPQIDVTFQTIEMIDDSDDLSTGEFHFGFFVNDMHKPNGQGLYYNNGDLGSGQNAAINVKASITGSNLVVKAIGIDGDQTFFFGLNEGGPLFSRIPPLSVHTDFRV